MSLSAVEASLATVNVFLEALPPARQTFDVPLLIVIETGNSLNGATVATYGSTSEVDAALAASYITAQTAAFARAALSQQPRPPSVKVTTAGTMAGDYGTAYTAARAADDAFYTVSLDDPTAAEVLAVSAAIETDGDRLLIAHSTDGDWLTSGVPVAFTAVADRERTGLVYHTSATDPIGVAWASARLASANPDNRSVKWSGRVRAVSAYSAELTSSQLGFAQANFINVRGPAGDAAHYLVKGVNTKGRPLYEVLTGDWIRARIREDLIQARVDADDRGEKILVGAVGDTSSDGQTLVRNLIEGRLQQGVDARHFTQGQTRVTMPPITQDDLNTGRIRANVEAQVGVAADAFTVNVYQGASSLAEA